MVGQDGVGWDWRCTGDVRDDRTGPRVGGTEVGEACWVRIVSGWLLCSKSKD